VKIHATTMKIKPAPSSAFFITMFAVFIIAGGYAQGQDVPFPAYGAGAVQVRIYTDYFCPPCRGMEPAVEPILRELVKKNVIRLTLVDTPVYRDSALYARYFLYALNAKNDFEHALMVRNTLFEAAAKKNITTAEKIEELFKSKGIHYSAFEPKPAFNQYNAFIKEDKINATPSCVIITGGEKKTFVGGTDIINALKGLM